MVADADRDVELFAAGMRRPRQHREVVIGRDADEGPVSAERHQPRNRQVGVAAEPVLGDDRTRRNVGAGFLFEEARYRQFVGKRRIRDDLFLARRRRHHTMRQRLLDRGNQRGLHLFERAAQSQGKPWQRIEQIAYDRHRCPRRKFPATLVKCSAGPLSVSARQPATSYSSLTGCEIVTRSPAARRADRKARIDCRESRRLAVGGILRLHVCLTSQCP